VGKLGDFGMPRSKTKVSDSGVLWVGRIRCVSKKQEFRGGKKVGKRGGEMRGGQGISCQAVGSTTTGSKNQREAV